MAYLYRHIRPDKNLPFYIGVGVDNEGKYKRANSRQNRNRHWHNIVNKLGYEIEIIIDDIEWEAALEKEKEFIKIYGRKQFGGLLVNLTDGGEGVIGQVVSDETRKKQSLQKIGKSPSNKGKPMPDHVKEIIRLANKGRPSWNKGSKMKQESIDKRAASMLITGYKKGKDHPQWGKKMSDNVREKLRIANENRDAWNKGIKMSPEQILKSGLLSGKNKKSVLKYDLDGEFIEEYESLTIAAKKNNLTKGCLCKAAKSGKMNKCVGYLWAYKKEEGITLL